MHPVSAIWVALLFLGIHQIEGHVVVPKVMGSALRLHPLLVIFGLLAGLEIYGLLGVLRGAAAARGRPRGVGVLLGPRRARAVEGGGPVPVEVELEERRTPAGSGPPTRRFPA